MTLENKQDPIALLRSWPALSPSKERGIVEHEDKADWEARADVIVRAAIDAGSGDEGALAALDAPPLPLEPGEPSEPERASAGEIKMSQENESSGPRAAGSVAPPERKRTSLKAIAERASQTGARPSAVPPVSSARSSVPGPAASSSMNSRPSFSSRPGMSSRPSFEPEGDDSGVVDLSAGQAPATPPPAIAAAAPESAQPVASKPAESAPATVKAAAAPGPAQVIAIAPRAAAKKGNGGMIAGVAIAVCGIAAAFAIMQTHKPSVGTTVATPEAKPVDVAPVPEKPAENAKPAGELAATPPTPAPSAEVVAETDSNKPSAPKAGGAVAPQPPGAAASAPVAAVGKEAPAGDKAAPPKEPGKPGDLASEMARAVGSDGKVKDDSAGTLEPAAGNPKSQSIPEQPSQGSVSSWKNAVISGAKACVGGAGTDDVSRATVTFASDGSVSSVSVSGWAADNGKAECIKAALKGANVGPFSKSSFTFGLPIRP